jgi:hypothetical protein
MPDLSQAKLSQAVTTKVFLPKSAYLLILVSKARQFLTTLELITNCRERGNVLMQRRAGRYQEVPEHQEPLEKHWKNS